MSTSKPPPHASVPRIQALSEHVINQIAAGEVIDRPAAVVKELVENALDSGARHIAIDLEQGGMQRVRVADDGCGIASQDLVLALSAHATSKLTQVEDLDHIASLGFRGEALASMASVARVRIVSRPAGELAGAAIECNGGELGPVRAEGAPLGTSVEVRDLFFHTPARRRFLKSVAAELGRCLDVLQRLALASSGVGFEVTHDGKRVFELEPSFDMLARIRRLFGNELAATLQPVEAQDGSTRLSGFVAPPRFARADSARQMWFLSGRPVRDKILQRCLKDAYRGFLFEGRHPVAFLSLAMEPGAVDVNVHPAKTEVRLRDERRVFSFLVHHLREAVKRTDMATTGERLIEMATRREQRQMAFEPRPLPVGLRPHGAGARLVFEDLPLPPNQAAATKEAQPGYAAATGSAASLPQAAGDARDAGEAGLGPCLQIAKTYLVRALFDGFEVIDQHALHERVTFETLKRDFQNGTLEVQRRLVPELVDVSLDEAVAIEEHFEHLAKVGVLLARFGEKTLAVHGLPACLSRPRPAQIVRGILDAIAARGRSPQVLELLEEVLHRTACRSSVMAGDALSAAEMASLIERGRALESDQTCVHGRPTRVRFTLHELERAFLRKS